MDLEKFIEEVTQLKQEREVLAKRVVELEKENKQIKGESQQLATALEANTKETDKVKQQIDLLEENIKGAIYHLTLTNKEEKK